MAQGNLVLNNSHNQSAMAAFGTFTNAHQNNGNARMGSEAVPTIDGVPLRLLAQKFAGGNGLFEVTQDYVKFGDISNLKLVNASPGAVQINNYSGNVNRINVNQLQNAQLSDFSTKQSPVSGYFTKLNSNITATNQCLAGMYSLPEANQVTYASSYGNGSIQGFTNGKVNYLNWSNNISGTPIYSILSPTGTNLANNNGAPSTNSPLVIKVPSGTTTINDPLDFLNGKSDTPGQSTSVLWDLSQVTGTVTFNNFQGGAIYAPNANLALNIQFSVNSQILGKDITVTSSSDGEEVHQLNFLPNLPCGQTTPTTNPATQSLSLAKTVDGKTPTSSQQFNFALTRQSAPSGAAAFTSKTVSNNGGSISFPNIEQYSTDGSYVYKVVENSAGTGYETNSQTFYAKVAVTYTTSGSTTTYAAAAPVWYTDAALTQAVVGTPTFANVTKKTIVPATQSLSLAKTVDGKTPTSSQQFNFALTRQSAPSGAAAFTSKTVSNNGGSISFPNIEQYSTDGSYVYKVVENSAGTGYETNSQTFYAKVAVTYTTSGSTTTYAAAAPVWYTDAALTQAVVGTPTFANVTVIPPASNLPLTGGVGFGAWGLPILIGVVLITGAGIAIRKGKGALMSR
ncbi:MAG: hypothetical protein LKF49_09160 [Bifidobacterium tibiigranuli]|uniref:Spy0128 family protein n=1 Tax=Bifidobacterium tibiigranuli TaxID=2172043 RepID=UPI002354687B|nr:FctA domain-containing protein [Bifidobacterium tibiigranuli]MCH3975879.1 hypothetical protein [Bifidobacterium tibiigranuli]MCH4204356.1 hypothetical protein [Bifidobacterium tibiigranuli]MCH4275123.1 hypothetical protein [Bifidobacterium tibiigranuli]